MTLLTLGHGCVDFASGAVIGLLPLLKEELDLSYTLVAVILAASMTSAIVQPLFGLRRFQRHSPSALPLAVLLAGAAVALVAVASSYALVVGLVVVAGLGIAAYHPPASELTVRYSFPRHAAGMSVFASGGIIGYATGALAAGAATTALGPRGGLLLVLPFVAVASVMRGVHWRRPRSPIRRAATITGSSNTTAIRHAHRPLLLVLLITTFTSVAWFGLLAFLPFWASEEGRSTAEARGLVPIVLLAGVGTILLQGNVIDRGRGRLVTFTNLMFLSVAIILLPNTKGLILYPLLCIVGMTAMATIVTMSILSQQFLPDALAVASGLSGGLALGIGGLAAVALGAVADRVNVVTALYGAAGVATIAMLLALALPGSEQQLRQPKRCRPRSDRAAVTRST